MCLLSKMKNYSIHCKMCYLYVYFRLVVLPRVVQAFSFVCHIFIAAYFVVCHLPTFAILTFLQREKKSIDQKRICLFYETVTAANYCDSVEENVFG